MSEEDTDIENEFVNVGLQAIKREEKEIFTSHREHMLLDIYDIYSLTYIILAFIFTILSILMVIKIFCCNPCSWCKKKNKKLDTSKKEQ